MREGTNKAGGNDAGPLGAEVLGVLRNTLEAYRSTLDPRAAGGTETPASGAETAETSFPQNQALLRFVSQAFLVFSTSGVRYWTRAAQAYAQCYPEIYRLLAAKNSWNLQDTGEQRELLDRVRATLRELAELSGQESRWTQAELAKLEEHLLSDASRQAGVYARRHKCKS